MVTKSVAACILSGALASVLLPAGRLVVPAYAAGRVVERAAKVARTADTSVTASVPTPHERKECLPSGKRAAVPRASTHGIPSSVRQGQQSHTATCHLGTFTVRAYTQYQRPGKGRRRTATGTVPTAGRTVAVDPHVIPLGSKIHIEGVGERIAEDSGGSIKGKKLDLFLPSVEHCRRFGVRLRNVQVITE